MTDVRKPMPIEICRRVQHMSSDVTQYGRPSTYYYTPKKSESAKKALEALEGALLESRKLHNKNLPAIENNMTLRTEISGLMTAHGIPRTYQERDMKSRKQIKPWITRSAGWITDLDREIKTSDLIANEEARYLVLKAYFEKVLKEETEKEQFEADKDKREAKALAKKRLEDTKFAMACVRNGISPIDDEGDALDYYDVLDELRSKNQRLDLALAMLETRNDWTDGYYRVDSALGRFKIENDEDDAIFTTVSEVCDEENGVDGRVFRDCAWSYDRIFATLDDALYDDAMFLYGKIHETD